MVTAPIIVSEKYIIRGVKVLFSLSLACRSNQRYFFPTTNEIRDAGMKANTVHGATSVIITATAACSTTDCANCRMSEGSFSSKHSTSLEKTLRKASFSSFSKCWTDVLSSVEIALSWMRMDDRRPHKSRNRALRRSSMT